MILRLNLLPRNINGKMKHKFYFLPLLLLVSCAGRGSVMPQVETVSWHGWDRSVKMSNGTVAVILNPEYGGGVTFFGFCGEGAASEDDNVLWNDDVIDGWGLEDYLRTGRSPSAGRFDVGNERKTENLHAELWAGEYSVAVGPDNSVSLISPESEALGIRLERKYELDPVEPELTITHTMENISEEEVEYCFWTRTLLPSGGIFFCDVDSTEAYPHGYSEMAFEPDRLVPVPGHEDRVLCRHGKFVALPGGAQAKKYGIFNTDGVTCYRNRDVLYVKEFEYVRDGRYDCNPGHGSFPMMIYFNADFIEMEPNSPMFRLPPGGSVSFLETWRLGKVRD